jgi:hypothetical protein
MFTIALTMLLAHFVARSLPCLRALGLPEELHLRRVTSSLVSLRRLTPLRMLPALPPLPDLR